MTTQVLRGKIEPLALIDVLAYLGRSKASGVLRVYHEAVEKSILINEGTIVFARSNLTQDRLGDFLLANRQISQINYDQATALSLEKGIRHGRALVEIGAITPKQLWETIQNQVRTIASSVIPWENGQFEFFKQAIKKKESITLQWPIIEMIQDVIRNLDRVQLFKNRFTDTNEILSIEGTAVEEPNLEPYEAHILQFIDGKSSIATICERSDYGELETMRVLYLLKSLGHVVVVASEPIFETTHPMVENFNKMYGYLNEYLTERVGAMGISLLRKYFEETRKGYPLIFEGVNLTDQGTLQMIQIQVNLSKLDENDPDVTAALDDALNEYLNVCILAVTKLLGADHEATVLAKIAEFV